MTTIYFVRHAEPNYNNHDNASRELTEKGLKDSVCVTEYLKKCAINAVYCSPYKRSIQTIRDFANKQNLTIKIVDDFRERKISDGWVDDFKSFAKNQWTDFDYKELSGESLKDVQNRNIKALEQVLMDHQNQNIVIGTHGTALSTIINYYDGSFGYAGFEKIRPLMPLIYKFDFKGHDLVSFEKVEAKLSADIC